MRVRIHRGTNEVGGTCVEVCVGSIAVLLDVGSPLETPDRRPALLPQSLDPATLRNLSGVVVSHVHPDHCGLLGEVPREVPVHGPVAARKMVDAGNRLLGRTVIDAGRAWRPLQDREPIAIGGLSVTPLLVDHSAYESYALLIEGGGRRLPYSGDLRAHGRKPGLWRRLTRAGLGEVDTLLLEGTTLSRVPSESVAFTESLVEHRLVERCREVSGLVLVSASPQNIDRMVSLYRAARRSGRDLVIDTYSAATLDACDRSTVPKPTWKGIRVFEPVSQRRTIRRVHGGAALPAVPGQRIYAPQMKRRPRSVLWLVRASMRREIESCLTGRDNHLVWSLWAGYLDNPSGWSFKQWLAEQSVSLELNHASGHASPADLRALIEAISPHRVVPVHATAGDRFQLLTDRSTQQKDGIWWKA